MKGAIVCGGSIRDFQHIERHLAGAELIIAADSGAACLMRMGIRPHILAGDFDSIPPPDLELLVASGIETHRFPIEKDMTDSELAVELALERGCDAVVLLGAVGTRLDHSLSNIYLLKKLLQRGVKGMLADEYNEVYLTNSSITVEKEEGFMLSLLPFTDRVEGVTTRGLYYPLKDAVLETGSSLGISNEFAQASATVTVSGGLLLVIKSRE